MFDNYVNQFKELSLVDKRDKIIDNLKLMIVILEKMYVDNNIPYREVKSKEILVLNDDNCSEEDYLEALFVYVEYLKEVLGSYFYKAIN